jgi:hypothetical protein
MLFADLTNPSLADLVNTNARMASVFLNAVGVDLPTPEMEADARDAACIGQDDRVLCIEDDTTDDGTVIPADAYLD